jgi:hypothetical protein
VQGNAVSPGRDQAAMRKETQNTWLEEWGGIRYWEIHTAYAAHGKQPITLMNCYGSRLPADVDVVGQIPRKADLSSGQGRCAPAFCNGRMWLRFAIIKVPLCMKGCSSGRKY